MKNEWSNELLGLGQTLNFSWEEPNLAVKFMKSSTSGSVKFVWMSLDIYADISSDLALPYPTALMKEVYGRFAYESFCQRPVR